MDFRRATLRRSVGRWVILAAFGGFCGTTVRSQDETLDFSLDTLLHEARELFDENLQNDTLTLPEPDPAQMDQFFRDFQEQLQGEYVVDLAPFKAGADFLLPLMEAHEPLKDLAAWLRSRRDYFDALDELQIVIPPPSAIPSMPATNLPIRVPIENPIQELVIPSTTLRTNQSNSSVTKLNHPSGPAPTHQVTVEVVLGHEPDEDVSDKTLQPVPTQIARIPTAPTPTPGNSLPAPSERILKPSLSPGDRENPPAAAVRQVWAHQYRSRGVPASAPALISRLKPIFSAEGVPPELVWLAEVESGFEVRARSPVGAVGLYQLMPITAKGLGLSTFPFDERKDPEKSGRAAAQLLSQLYERFRDWRLVLAAYNAGPTRVQNLLKSHKTQNYDEIARYLPVETQLYVPKVEAAVYRREGVRLEALAWPLPRKPVPTVTGEGAK